MKLQNVDSRDNNGYYEVLIVNFKDADQMDKVWDNMLAADFIVELNGDDDELSIASDNYMTKQDFINNVRKVMKA